MSSKFWSFALLVSLALHSSLWFVYDYEQKKAAQKLRSVPVFVSSILSPKDLDALVREQRSVVNSAAPVARDPRKPAKFLSEQTRRVDRETVSRGHRPPSETTPESEGDGDNHQPGERLRRLGMRTTVSSAKQDSTSDGTGLLRHPASVGDSIDVLPSEIVQGSETQLNTDEYRFASFFNRMKADIEPRWSPVIGQITRRHWRTLPEGIYLTEVAIGTADDGKITWVEIKKSSGYGDFDQAAVDAVWEVGRVKNLPKELLSHEGRYKTSFTFVVELSKKGMMFDTMTENEQKRWPGHVPKSR